jgi:alkylhydroperoxidase family enzyme
MARLPLVDPATDDATAAALLQRIVDERGQAFNVYRMLANSPGVLERVYGLASHLWNDSDLEPPLQELVILRVAQLTGSDYEWARHRGLARRVGVPDRQVEGLSDWRTSQLYRPAERAALRLTEEMTRDVEATPDAVADVSELLGAKATLELAVLIGLYGLVARVLRSLDVDAEPGDESLPA